MPDHHDNEPLWTRSILTCTVWHLYHRAGQSARSSTLGTECGAGLYNINGFIHGIRLVASRPNHMFLDLDTPALSFHQTNVPSNPSSTNPRRYPPSSRPLPSSCPDLPACASTTSPGTTPRPSGSKPTIQPLTSRRICCISTCMHRYCCLATPAVLLTDLAYTRPASPKKNHSLSHVKSSLYTTTGSLHG